MTPSQNVCLCCNKERILLEWKLSEFSLGTGPILNRIKHFTVLGREQSWDVPSCRESPVQKIPPPLIHANLPSGKRNTASTVPDPFCNSSISCWVMLIWHNLRNKGGCPSSLGRLCDFLTTHLTNPSIYAVLAQTKHHYKLERSLLNAPSDAFKHMHIRISLKNKTINYI